MITPAGYSYELTESKARKHFPNSKIGSNIIFTSLKGDEYNCAAWAIEIIDQWVEFKDKNGNYDLSIDRYVQYYEEHGFSKCDNKEPEYGIIKIAIYADEKEEFTHVARQIQGGKWTSKLGDWEDVEHNDLDVLSGQSYGKPHTFMQKKIKLSI